jgi:hypothetical protein
MNAPAQLVPSLRAAHHFRSRFIDSFSELEVWTISAWRDLAARSHIEGKVPPHFGNRLKVIRELAKKQPSLFSTPAELVSILDQAEPYCRLRITLMHGRLETVIAEDGSQIFCVDNPLDEPTERFSRRIALRAAELNCIIQKLDRIAARLKSQTLASAPNAPAQPRPPQAPASSPAPPQARSPQSPAQPPAKARPPAPPFRSAG